MKFEIEKSEDRKKIRCAIYTRKSSEEGLKKDFNTLHAQREICESYIKTQAEHSWNVIPESFDDGGYSGGKMERPALQRLIDAVQDGKIDIIVVYKIDRLTRSLFDFTKLTSLFDRYSVGFVSVSESFNTTSPIGRLTLNMILSFAQFERELAGERIRDKYALSKRRGLWMGGSPPLGYRVDGQNLDVVPDEAETVRVIFRKYLEIGSSAGVAKAINQTGCVSKKRVAGRSSKTGDATGGNAFHPATISWILGNSAYIGKTRYKGEEFEGQHEPIVSVDLWEKVRDRMMSRRLALETARTEAASYILTGRIWDDEGQRLKSVSGGKGKGRCRYYVGPERQIGQGLRISLRANRIERFVIDMIIRLLSDPERLELSLQAVKKRLRNNQIKVQAAAALLAEKLKSDYHRDSWIKLRSLLSRVEILPEIVRVTIDACQLAHIIRAVGGSRRADSESVPFVLESAADFFHRPEAYCSIRIASAKESRIDEKLVTIVAKAHHWIRLLKLNQVGSLSDIAKREDLPISLIERWLPVAFLAPDITETIVDGHQPEGFDDRALLEIATATCLWSEQRRMFRAQ